ncbi:hypothetical protein [Obesumbacterium proteus]|uniref:hypothetical protein n=1 Tax=Obesumbacterium proteus TaxID=82983 RepID=UPI00242EA87A|nr:hypothetical protein [Obesumbacterium proteus]
MSIPDCCIKIIRYTNYTNTSVNNFKRHQFAHDTYIALIASKKNCFMRNNSYITDNYQIENVNFSYSNKYCSFIYSKDKNVSIDIEYESVNENKKNHYANQKPYKNLPMDNKKEWVISESAAKYFKIGVSAILKGVTLIFIGNKGRYEEWKVQLIDRKRGRAFYLETRVFYRFINHKLHVAFCKND